MDIFEIQLLINFSTEIDCAGCAFTHSRFDRLNDRQGNKPVKAELYLTKEHDNEIFL